MIKMTKMTIEEAEYRLFQRMHTSGSHAGLRYGQAFFNHFGLHKCIQNKEICDRLYELDGEEAQAYIAEQFIIE